MRAAYAGGRVSSSSAQMRFDMQNGAWDHIASMKRISEKMRFARWEAWMIHTLTVTAGICIALSGIYALWKLTLFVVVSVLIISLITGWMLRPRGPWAPVRMEGRGGRWTTIAMTVAADTAVLALLVLGRTDAAIASPWQAVPWIILPLYGIATAFLPYAVASAYPRQAIPLLTLHAAVTWGVSLIVYRLGFGYDPFVHQATERAIVSHGSIFPKTPFYIGQYVVVAGTSILTHLPVAWIDRLLVPVVASLTLPSMAFMALRRMWVPRMAHPGIGVAALFLLPIGYAAFTAPFNLALLPFLFIVLFLPLASDPRIRAFLIAMALAALAIHPLIGIPAVLIAGAGMIRKSRAAIPMVIAGIPAGLLAAFFFYVSRQGVSLPWPTVWSLIRAALAIFGNPYQLALGSPWLAFYYALLYASPIILLAFGAHGLIRLAERRADIQHATMVLLATTVGLVISAIAISTVFVIPNIINAEQFEFSLRLLVILPLVLLPGLMGAFGFLFVKRSPYVMIAACVLAGVLSAGAWYAAYPQYNAVASFPAPGLSRSDLDAVQYIERDAGAASYAVLSHQMMGAAALQTFGFDRSVQTTEGNLYAYAIPTGGTLYRFYLRLLSEDPDPTAVRNELLQFIQADRIYVALPRAWDVRGSVDERLRPLSVASADVGDIRIYQLK